MRALGDQPDIYDRLVKSVAPSIWQMDDVKKGILAQLFGGSSKACAPRHCPLLPGTASHAHRTLPL